MVHIPPCGRGCLLAVSIIVLFGCGATPQARVERGNRYFDSGKFDDAAIQYRKALQKSPDMGDAHYRLGLTELKRNNLVAAFQELRQANDRMPGNSTVAAQFGQLVLGLYTADPRHSKEFHDQTDKVADRLLAENARDFDGNMLKGALSIIDKKPDAAVGYFRGALETKSGDPNAKLGLARALVDDDQKPAGIAVARDLIASDKTFGPAYDFLVVQYRASGDEQNAEDVLRLKVSNNPGEAAFLLELARYYATRQKPAEVAATIQRLVADPRTFPDGRMQVANFYASVGKPDEALGNYREGLQANPKDPLPWRKGMFRVYASQKKYAEALAQADAVLKQKPDDHEMKRARAELRIEQGKPEYLDSAIADLRGELKQSPDDPRMHFQLGNALALKGNQEDALREWSASARRNPAFLPPRYSMVRASLQRGDSQAALRTAEEIIAVAPRDPQARLMHAVCLTGAGQYQQAQRELNGLATQFPQSPQVQFRLGVLAISEHKFDEAEQIFRRLETSTGSDPAAFAGLAEAYRGKNESAKAIELLQSELKRNPGSALLHQVLARVAASSGRFDLAIDQYRQLLAAQPGSLNAQFALAASYRAAGDGKSAIELLDKSVQTHPESAEASLRLAQALVSVGRANDAKGHYRHVLQLQPDNPRALNDLAYLMADSGENLDQALSFATRAAQSAADPRLKTSLSDTVGWIYLKKKMYDDAVQTFQSLVNTNPNNPTYLYHLGATLYQKGDKARARTELDAALTAKPSPPVERDIRELLARL